MSPPVGLPIARYISRQSQIAAVQKGAHLQFTIETRDLSNPQSNQTTIEAASADEAITKFVHANASELMSVSKPCEGRESIATIRKDDAVYLVRVYAA